MLAATLGLFASLAGLPLGSAPTIVQISCFNDHTVLGVTSGHQLVTWDGSSWRESTVGADLLWHSPDDRVFAVGTGPFVQEVIRRTNLPATRWILPAAVRLPRLTYLDGIVAVTSEKMFRLDAGGRVTAIGATPMAPDQIARIPMILAAPGRLIACMRRPSAKPMRAREYAPHLLPAPTSTSSTSVTSQHCRGAVS